MFQDKSEPLELWFWPEIPVPEEEEEVQEEDNEGETKEEIVDEKDDVPEPEVETLEVHLFFHVV